METTGTGFVFDVFGLLPGEGANVIGPEVAEVICSFPAKDDKIRVFELCYVVGPFPGGRFALKGFDFNPVVGSQV